MSTGLTISKASYGSSSGTPVDVTSAVSSKVKDGSLKFTVSPSSLGIDDPAPGQQKSIEIDYIINGGRKNTILKKDNDLVSIDAPPERVASGLQIVKAEYGYSGNWTDVTNAVQDLMKSDGSIDIKVGFKELGLPDPNPNKQKQLSVEYTINGAQTSETYIDGQRFKVSAPAKEDLSNTPSIRDHVNNAMWSAPAFFARFLGVCVQLISGFGTAQYVESLMGPSSAFWWISFGLGFFIPLFAFIGLPILGFWVRLFRSDNVILA